MRPRTPTLCLLALLVAAATPAAAEPRLLVIGDSPAVGAEAPLAALPPDWRIRSVARVGQPLSEGMRVFRALEPAPVVTASRAAAVRRCAATFAPDH